MLGKLYTVVLPIESASVQLAASFEKALWPMEWASFHVTNGGFLLDTLSPIEWASMANYALM